MSQFELTPSENQRNYVLAAYVLFGISLFLGGLPSVIGVILAYVKRKDTLGTIYHDHFTFLIRTFWISFIGGIVGFILAFVGIGFLILIAVSLWYIFRIVIGAIRFFENKTITPTGWFM